MILSVFYIDKEHFLCQEGTVKISVTSQTGSVKILINWQKIVDSLFASIMYFL